MNKRPTNGLKRNDCMKIAKLTADAARSNDYTKLRAHLGSLDVSVGWRNDIDKFTAFLDSGEPAYTVFTKGNSKLPFYSFSTLPVYTCPGLGACAQWCYSFRSWQYPAAFFRQCQNTILAINQSEKLTEAFNGLPSTTVRLYVDGDYDSEDTLRYWMQRLKDRQPDIQAYGYSKSLHLFRALHDSGFQWPDNYKLNLSSGGKYMADLVKDLPVVRGVFVAVPIDRKALKIGRKTAYGTSKYNEAVREAGKKAGYNKSFVCPGKCGSCTKKGHACGLDSFQDIPILIGIH